VGEVRDERRAGLVADGAVILENVWLEKLPYLS